MSLQGRARQFYRLGQTVWGYLPFSGVGVLTLLGAAALVYYRGLGQQDILAFSGGLTLLLLCLLSLGSVLVKALYFVVERRKSTERLALQLDTQVASATGFRPRLWSLPWVFLRWSWTSPKAQVLFDPAMGYCEFCVFEQRTKTTQIVRQFQIADWLGLAGIQFSLPSEVNLTVLPHYGQLHRLPLLIRPSSGEDISDPRGEPIGDRIDMRQYTKGDSPRTILWKVYARTRRLMVRIPERALSMRPRVCLFLWCGDNDEAAAAVCRVAVEQGLLGQQWLFGCSRLPHTATHTAEALEMIAESGKEAPVCHSLAAFLKRAEGEGYGQCIVAAASVMGAEESKRLRSEAHGTPLKVSLCFACDGFDFTGGGPAPSTGWRRWVFRPSSGVTMSQAHVRELSRHWAAHPGEVMLIERTSGTFFSDVRHAERQLNAVRSPINVIEVAQ